MRSPVLTLDVAHPPRHPDVVERELLEALSKVRGAGSLRILKVIHGHGSTGKGGSTKGVVRNWAFRNRTRFKAIIDGENFDLFDRQTQDMRNDVGQFADVDLGMANRGVTIIWIK